MATGNLPTGGTVKSGFGGQAVMLVVKDKPRDGLELTDST